MTVRAKFKVVQITRQMGWNGQATEVQAIKLNPVYGNGDPNHENTKFYAATPGGCIDLQIVPLDVAKTFELGQEVYVDFTPAD